MVALRSVDPISGSPAHRPPANNKKSIAVNHAIRSRLRAVKQFNVADNRIVIELKAVEKILPIHSAQLLTYLRLGKFFLGHLMNFHVLKLVDGIERVSNHAPNLSATSAPSAFQNSGS